jgi:hypothetical protein
MNAVIRRSLSKSVALSRYIDCAIDEQTSESVPCVDLFNIATISSAAKEDLLVLKLLS